MNINIIINIYNIDINNIKPETHVRPWALLRSAELNTVSICSSLSGTSSLCITSWAWVQDLVWLGFFVNIITSCYYYLFLVGFRVCSVQDRVLRQNWYRSKA